MFKPLYITTTLPYVNADPHIGFALEIIQADVRARQARLEGREVFFNTGTDEHGQKIWEAAEKAGQTVQAYVDHYATEFQKLKSALNLSNDVFIRTTSPAHQAAAVAMWQRCAAAGDIYKKSYQGPYCVGCERFLTERDLADGLCLIHHTAPQILAEENYFFRFSKYQDHLQKYLSQPGVILPEWRREEALNFVREGLQDFSISREKTRLSWGVPVPGDETQVMYVWFDALTNYISTLGWPHSAEASRGKPDNFQKFWVEGETIQVAGKDQIRFQSLMWQAMLLSAGIKNTDQIFYHGFINSGGQKMSKSLGNVINPDELVSKYGTEATRYLLLRHVHPVDDSDVTWDRLDEWYTAHLVNGLGNLTARLLTLAEKYLPGPVTIHEAGPFPAEYTKALANFEFNLALDYIWGRITAADARVATEEPYNLVKTDLGRAQTVISELCTELYWIANLLQPFMPQTNELIKSAIKENKKPTNLFFRLLS